MAARLKVGRMIHRAHGRRWLAALAAAALAGCQGAPTQPRPTFRSDLAFLQQHIETIVLTTPTGARAAVVPAWQGRVMTSTCGGEDDPSFGWLNRAHIASRTLVPHINVFGGEDRFWIGPEGGQFAVFFAPGAPFELATWQTPAAIDTEPYDVVERDHRRVVLAHAFALTNWTGTRFSCAVRREVSMLDPAEMLARHGIAMSPDLRAVAYESANTLRNAGDAPWTRDTGLLSIWILGMFPASPRCEVYVPFVRGPERYHGPVVNDEYFGRVPPDRLVIDEERGVVIFRGDARHRGKIGIGPRRAKPLLGSWDGEAGVLTLVEFTLPIDAHEYVNSLWRLQDDPYGGDVVNSYNDGPPAPGGRGLGDFYELESSSPALALLPGEAATHVHRTLHLTGPRQELAVLASRLFGVDPQRIAAGDAAVLEQRR